MYVFKISILKQVDFKIKNLQNQLIWSLAISL